MSDVLKEEYIEEVLDLTELAIGTLDLDDADDIEIILSMVDILESECTLPYKKRRKEWVKPCRLEREARGSFSLTDEISSDTSFFNNIAMNEEIFNYILGRVEKDIQKQDTICRKSVSPAEKLAATIRYLATGDSYRIINDITQLSGSFLSTAIPNVCEAICRHFEEEYLKVRYNFI